MPRSRQEDGEFRKWIQTHTPAWELVWDRPNLATAATLAARHAVGLAGPDKPFYIAGYSTGAPLALMYALHAIDDASRPMPNVSRIDAAVRADSAAQ